MQIVPQKIEFQEKQDLVVRRLEFEHFLRTPEQLGAARVAYMGSDLPLPSKEEKKISK